MISIFAHIITHRASRGDTVGQNSLLVFQNRHLLAQYYRLYNDSQKCDSHENKTIAYLAQAFDDPATGVVLAVHALFQGHLCVQSNPSYSSSHSRPLLDGETCPINERSHTASGCPYFAVPVS